MRFQVESHEHPECLAGALRGLVDFTHLQVGQSRPGVGEGSVECMVARVGGRQCGLEQPQRLDRITGCPGRGRCSR